MDRPRTRISATVIGAPDPRSLADFYERLLGWDRPVDKPEWVMLRPPAGGTGLSFQLETDFNRPVWPPNGWEQQMMMHLDIAADDEGVAFLPSTGPTADIRRTCPERGLVGEQASFACVFPGLAGHGRAGVWQVHRR